MPYDPSRHVRELMTPRTPTVPLRLRTRSELRAERRRELLAVLAILAVVALSVSLLLMLPLVAVP